MDSIFDVLVYLLLGLSILGLILSLNVVVNLIILSKDKRIKELWK